MEFDIINKYFNWPYQDNTILESVGDDCAIIQNPNKLVISTDTLNSGVHFSNNASASDIAYKALAVNLSDIASMGGIPKYFTLNLSLPEIDNIWLLEFARSLKNLAEKYKVKLVGGDTTKSMILSISITIIGESTKPITRSGAKHGDGIFVSNTLGGPSLALKQINNKENINKLALEKLQRPIPQIDLGLNLVDIANSCIDISDGLVQDLSHILEKSMVGANLWSDKIPIFPQSDLDNALYGGDEYELCFSADVNKISQLQNISQIGVINDSGILTLDDKKIEVTGYKHF